MPEPHDVLAAEEFGIGGRDERWPPDPLGVTDPHDTLAAEEFIIGTRDDRWPRDPSGYDVPHDVLAAEAFPMPVPDRGGAMPRKRRGACPAAGRPRVWARPPSDSRR